MRRFPMPFTDKNNSVMSHCDFPLLYYQTSMKATALAPSKASGVGLCYEPTTMNLFKRGNTSTESSAAHHAVAHDPHNISAFHVPPNQNVQSKPRGQVNRAVRLQLSANACSRCLLKINNTLKCHITIAAFSVLPAADCFSLP